MTDSEKQAAITKKIGELYPQLRINCKKVCGQGFDLWGENLISHIITEFLSIKLDKQYKILVEDEAGENYITRSMAMSLKSSTSTFYRKHRRDSQSYREILPDWKYPNLVEDGEELDVSEVKDCLRYHVENTLDFYDKYLIQEHYYNGSNLTVISENTGIQPYRVTADIKKALKKLKKLCGASL
jgi:hypothetical protein